MNLINHYDRPSHKKNFNGSVCRWIKPSHFITLSLCQGRMIPNDETLSGVFWLKGDDAIYTYMHVRFVESLSKQLATRTAWKYHRPILRSAFAIEGDIKDTRTHAHMIIAKPVDVDEARFCSSVRDTAAGNNWIMNGDYAVHIESLSSVSENSRSVSYTTKNGFGRLSFT
jgi:hypothetical protein